MKLNATLVFLFTMLFTACGESATPSLDAGTEPTIDASTDSAIDAADPCDDVECGDPLAAPQFCDLACEEPVDPCEGVVCGDALEFECGLDCKTPDPCEGVVCGDAMASACGLTCEPACDPNEVVDYEETGGYLVHWVDVRPIPGKGNQYCNYANAPNRGTPVSNDTIVRYPNPGGCLLGWTGGAEMTAWNGVSRHVYLYGTNGHTLVFHLDTWEFTVTKSYTGTGGMDPHVYVHDFHVETETVPVYRVCP